MKKIFFLSTGLLFLFTGSALLAAPMKVAPQDIGFNDVNFNSLQREACADCHDSPADTHHATSKASSGKCASCHAVSKKPGKTGVFLERACVKCHKKSPHHQTEAALNKECTSCHDSLGLSDYSMKLPGYEPSNVTPTRSTCKKCHKEGVVGSLKVVSIKDAHHGISLKPCTICHLDKQKGTQDIRVCERCHNAKSIHEVSAHIDENNCIECHDFRVSAKPAEAKK
ncbi:MAG: hypothetical protein GY864_02300 [Desulfobacterales bacterium]|nr:hypothetical protein [Desulfobacterales bacterium]